MQGSRNGGEMRNGATKAASSGGNLRPVAFLDRDGVINVDHNYVHRVDQLEWIDGAAEAIKILNDASYLVIVVTNQSGIARGFYAEVTLAIFHDHMRRHLADRGASIDALYYCPHHPDGTVAAFARRCDCRKPGSGMLEQASRDFSIDPAASFLIGDKDIDMEAAAAFGIRGWKFDASIQSLPDLVLRILASG
jgi:D-glycero-D-manno-heptose 1,7-bisphosphate phosphatase